MGAKFNRPLIISRRVAMKNKGLCSTCTNDKECTFHRKFPIWQCEEFADYESGSINVKRQKQKKQQKKKIKRGLDE